MKTNRLYFLVIFLLLVAIGVSAQESNRLYIPDINVEAGKQFQLPIYVQNTSQKITGVQFTISVPKGVTPDFDGIKLTERSGNHKVKWHKDNDSQWTLMLYSSRNVTIKANAGVILNIPAIVADSVKEGSTKELGLEKVALSDSIGKNVLTEFSCGKINIAKTPDFIITDIKSDLTTINPEDNVNIEWKVKNIGSVSSTGGWSEVISLVSEDGDAKVLATTHYNDGVLASGAEISRKMSIRLERALGVGGKGHFKIELKPNADSGERDANIGNNISESVQSGLTINQRLYVTMADRMDEPSSDKSLIMTVLRSGSWKSNEVLTITKQGDDRVQLPENTIIPASNSECSFTLKVKGDEILNEDSLFTIIVAADGYESVRKELIIVDDDIPHLKITSASKELQEGGKMTVTITNERAPKSPLTINIKSDLASRLKYPATVIMEAGQKTATFELEALQDTEVTDTLTAAINISADNHHSDELLIFFVDDDMPELELTLKPTTVGEGDGPTSIIGKIIRKTKVENKVTIVLSDDSDGQLYYGLQNNKLVLNAGVTEAEFSMGAIDNADVDGTRHYIVTAAVYISSCSCTVKGSSAGSVSQQITVTDDDGPTVKVVSSNTSIKEGGQATLNITINTDTSEDVQLELSSDFDDMLDYNHQVVIPAGEKSVDVTITAKKNEVAEDDRIIVFTVNANGYTAGTCYIQLTDQTIPDVSITNFTVTPSELEVGQKAKLEVTLKNTGNAILPSLARINFYISNSTKELAHAYTADELAVGDEMVLTHEIDMPNTTGQFTLRAEVNEDKAIKELTYSNNTSKNVSITLLPAFTATAQTDKKQYATGETVVISGKATGTKATNADIEVYYINEGNRQTITTKTDDNGNYSIEYTLPQLMSGHFIVGACYPNEKLESEMDSFDVYGLRLSSATNNCSFYLDEVFSGKVTIANAVNIKQTGLKVAQNSVSDNCEFAFTLPEVIDPNESFDLNFTITPSAVSTGRDWQKMNITVSSNEGASTDYCLYYYINSREALLNTDVSSINTTMTKGAKRDYPIVITNRGEGETGKITLALPNWIKTSTPKEMASLQQGDSATIVLQLCPTEDMQLNVPVTGRLAINCENGDGIPITFSITPVSETEGKLIVDVVDEFTFETQEAPHVGNATIKIMHPITGNVIAQGVSGEDGKFSVTIPEGQYAVSVTADKHEEYTNQIIVNAGKDNNHEAFVSYEAVTYSWNAEETEIEDSYEIETIVKFEARVPKPVLLISLPKERPEDGSVIPIVVTNKGYINAEDVNVSLAISGNWDIEFLTEPYLAKLAANQSEVFYAKLKSKVANQAGTRAPSLRECLSLQAKLRAHYICGNKYDNTVTADDLRKWGECLKYAASQYSYGGGGGYGGYGGGGGYSGYGSGWAQIVPIPVKSCNPKNTKPNEGGNSGDNTEIDWNNYKYDSEKDPFWTPCKNDVLGGLSNCAGSIGFALVKGGLYSIPGLGCIYGLGTSCLLPLINKKMTGFAYLGCLSSALGCFVPGEEIIQGLVVAGLGCAATIVDLYLSCNNINIFGDDYKPNETRANKTKSVVEYNHNDPFDNYMYKLAVIKEESNYFMGYMSELFGDESWVNSTPEEIANLIDYLGTFSSEETIIINEDLLKYKPSSISSDVFQHFIERYNNTTSGYDTNYQNMDNYINGDVVLNYLNRIDFCEEYAMSEGFLSSSEMIENAYDSFIKYLISIKADEESDGSNSVCSTITLSFKQEMVMTRQAFRGTLTVNNGNATNEMKDVKLNLEVRDESGNLATSHEFQINAESLKGFNGELDFASGWTLEANGTGIATILFIPTKYAAPTESKKWSFGGSFSYTDPTTGLTVTKTLNPITLTVKPSPNLTMDYFMQRDVLGDDALTEDIVEPTVPAEFSLLINNKGYGDATNVKMVTNQPEIIDNEKGLLIDFEILSSQLNGGEKTLTLGQSVATDFGTIPAGKTSYAQWWFTSSLLGHFTEYNVKATHLTSYGNPDLSLLDTVIVHELIHTLTIPASSNMRGFLVNDVKDTNDMPDKLYLTDGTTRTVANASATITEDGNNQYTLTVSPSAEGWNYGSLTDPTAGRKTLASITRQSDGASIDLSSFWQTDRTLRDGKDPLYEFRLQFADEMSASGEAYTLKFEDKPITVLDVESFEGVSETDIINTPVEKITVLFNKEIAASSFTTEDLELRRAGSKLDVDKIVISQVNEKQFDLDLKELTSENGYYVLTVQAAGIRDKEGYTGEFGRQLTWTQLKDGVLEVQLDYEAQPGWNWISSSLAEADKKEAKTFLEPIKDQVIRLVGFENELINDPVYGFVGKLTTISPENGYKLHVKGSTQFSYSGLASEPAAYSIDLKEGWNWIGYLPVNPLSVQDAMKNHSPMENDVLKGQDAFVTYTDGVWTGTLTEMKPGEGYMYYSSKDTSFKYPKVYALSMASRNVTTRAFMDEANPWLYDAHKYADNATLIGKLYVDDKHDVEGIHIVGAFAGDECRGVGKNINGLVYMVIHGDIGDSQMITFRTYNTITGIERAIQESIGFGGQSVGNVNNPQIFHVKSATGISSTEGGFYISPRPLKNTLYISGNTSNIKSVQILSTSGKTMQKSVGYDQSGIDVGMLLPSMYIVTITTNDGKVYYEKVFKK